MKRCPECYQVYPNTEVFCEADGKQLLTDPALSLNADGLLPPRTYSRPASVSWSTGLIGVLIGIILCTCAYLAYLVLNAQSERKEPARPPYAAQVRESSQPARPVSAPVAEPVPSASESPSPEPETTVSPAQTATQTEPASARLNRGPVSTGKGTAESEDGAPVKTVIEMQDGSSMEVDAAWKDTQGIWYRRGGLVSFVDGSRVKTITTRAEPKTSPAPIQ